MSAAIFASLSSSSSSSSAGPGRRAETPASLSHRVPRQSALTQARRRRTSKPGRVKPGVWRLRLGTEGSQWAAGVEPY
eukprot:2264290-Rhodomonas_salina.1